MEFLVLEDDATTRVGGVDHLLTVFGEVDEGGEVVLAPGFDL